MGDWGERSRVRHSEILFFNLSGFRSIYVIDEFDRQSVRSEDPINRWIVPLESKVDYLTLHTGKKFQIPCDEIVIIVRGVNGRFSGLPRRVPDTSPPKHTLRHG